MISEIRLSNFKCFDELNLPMKNVTVLTGINGMGKSTVIQSLLALKQSYQKDEKLGKLYLNGRYVSLGNAQDVLHEKATSDILGVGYSTTEGDMANGWFRYIVDSDQMPVWKMENGIIVGYVPACITERLVYISAYRIGPQDRYHVINEDELKKREFGNDGEFALQYLGMFGDAEVKIPTMILPDKLGNSLKNQMRLWLDRITPGVSPQVFVNMAQRMTEVRYEFIEGKKKTNSYRSVNVGFGITYVLPVIVALLSGEAGDVIVLENPEAHIHPAGQRMLGELIAMAGAGGVQVIVETHSDHILNGIRLSVKRDIICKEDVQIAFFYKDMEDGYRHKVCTPHVMMDGRLDIWPEGFFDEWDKALYELI